MSHYLYKNVKKWQSILLLYLYYIFSELFHFALTTEIKNYMVFSETTLMKLKVVSCQVTHEDVSVVIFPPQSCFNGLLLFS